MILNRFYSGIFLLFLLSFLAACVSPRIVEDLKKKNERCEKDNAILKEQNEKLSTEYNEMKATLEDYEKKLKGLKTDTGILRKSIALMTKNYNQINELYEILLQKNRELLAGNQSQNTSLMSKLQLTEVDLQKREDELRSLEKALGMKKAALDATRDELQERATRVNELEQMLADKDRAVNELKDKVVSALKGFKNKGLSVETKNGKVYVSLEAKLLFPSGSTSVDPKGKSALLKLAKVLEENEDVNVLVEGHTDTDKYKSSGGSIKDNWDLSVLRATAVVRIIKENSKVDPSRLTAAGRSEYLPVNDTKTSEGKAKNRRIEIILTPKLDELFQILESN
ncbi:MAG TPA: hypothetical protein EYN89_07235 [Flavobacteriales bacterium]|nr:hypothetical protein [Flavobacteriales bacterium]